MIDVRFPFAEPYDVDEQRKNGAILIAASIIAAIRPRGEPIKPSPKLSATVYDSVSLARMIMAQVLKG